MHKRSKLKIFAHNLKVLFKRKLLKNIIFLIILVLLIVFLVLFNMYNDNLKPVKAKAKDVTFIIEEGDTISSIALELKKQNLIKSELAYKIYVKFHNFKNLDVGIYSLNPNMGVKKIIKTLEKGTIYGTENITFTVPEGFNIEKIAEYSETVTNNTKEDIIATWKDPKFIDEAISKYWFLTEEIKNSEIRYPLEGYLFPETYYFDNKDITPEDIAYTMLDQMEEILNKYKSEIEANSYSLHQMLALASIIEKEGTIDKDRDKIASVFYNRLNSGMSLGSDVTTYYAVNKDFTEELTQQELDDCNGYNTRASCGITIPVGPICSPGLSSIISVIEPAQTNYYYFIGNICDGKSTDTYFAETYSEHQSNIARYLTC